MTVQNIDPSSTRHRWGDETRFAAGPEFSGCPRNEKTCVKCGVTKVTFIPPRPENPWNEWRTKSGAQFQCDHTPPCPVVAP